jgi:hypothetical protein
MRHTTVDCRSDTNDEWPREGERPGNRCVVRGSPASNVLIDIEAVALVDHLDHRIHDGEGDGNEQVLDHGAALVRLGDHDRLDGRDAVQAAHDAKSGRRDGDIVRDEETPRDITPDWGDAQRRVVPDDRVYETDKASKGGPNHVRTGADIPS